MMIYFQTDRKKPDSTTDVLNVPSLLSKSQSKIGTPMPVHQVITEFLETCPDGKIIITTETR